MKEPRDERGSTSYENSNPAVFARSHFRDAHWVPLYWKVLQPARRGSGAVDPERAIRCGAKQLRRLGPFQDRAIQPPRGCAPASSRRSTGCATSGSRPGSRCAASTRRASRGSGAECRWRGRRMGCPVRRCAAANQPVHRRSPEQVEVIQKINGYFNNLKNLEGDFLQTDADDKRKKGKFYIERPGKVRFDYSLPSKQKIISNGKYLAIEDHDLNTTDRYPLESTPFRLLLTKEVDLMRDANIIALDAGDNVVVVTVQDKEAGNGGQIRLFFDWPKLQLKEWIISDPQGLNTRIQLAEMQSEQGCRPEAVHIFARCGPAEVQGWSELSDFVYEPTLAS